MFLLCMFSFQIKNVMLGLHYFTLGNMNWLTSDWSSINYLRAIPAFPRVTQFLMDHPKKYIFVSRFNGLIDHPSPFQIPRTSCFRVGLFFSRMHARSRFKIMKTTFSFRQLAKKLPKLPSQLERDRVPRSQVLRSL